MKLKVAVGLTVLALLGFTVFGEHGILKLARYQREQRALADEAGRLRSENDQLRAEIVGLQNDPAYIERLARENLGMVKPGEFVIQFTDPAKSPPQHP